MNILIAGASGLIGQALTEHFENTGHRVIPLLRKDSSKPFNWQPDQGTIYLDDSVNIDVVINLAGPGVADRRWSAARKKQLLETRVNCTRILSQALAQREQQPTLFISASAIGFYGPRDDTPVDESSDSGSGFLAEISRQWESSTAAAEAAGIRTVHARFGIVLSKKGGALKRMLLPFRLGLGGVIGSGMQYMSWISMGDLLKIFEFLIEKEELAGPVNLVAPNPVTNREFTRVLGRVLKRPTVIPMPAFQARLLFGEMAQEILLTGARVLPTRLQDAGFEFAEPDLEQALGSVLGKR
jgi:uncharacterized protein (TIGR01777 family)